jgi:ferredoxin-NADP reductase
MIPNAIPSPPQFWNAEVDDTLICRAARRETHDVMTFVFEAASPRRFAFQPGQFMTFEFEVQGQKINRCYTIASSPTRPDRVSITVKRVPGGAVSAWLHETLKPGTAVKALGPMGDFTSAAYPAAKYLFLSAGSGVTPLMSMARAHHDLASEADIAFVHSARSPADLIFEAELALMARERPAFKVTAICEDDAPGRPWSGYRGRLDVARLALIVPDFTDREVFVCGPEPYMDAVRALLVNAGFDMARHHEESFNFALLTAEGPGAETSGPPAPDARTFKVEFAASGRVIDCPEDRFVLEAAKAAGLRLPSSCTKGMCGTCKSRLLSGAVAMNPAGGIRQREIDQGWVLICCSKPISDLVIER